MIMANLRCVEVHYSNGDIITTSMNANLTDEDIKNYFRIGRQFNVGSINDNLATVTKLIIIK